MEVYEKELTILGSNIDPFTFPEAVSLTAAMHQVRALDFILGQLREGTRGKRLGGGEICKKIIVNVPGGQTFNSSVSPSNLAGRTVQGLFELTDTVPFKGPQPRLDT